MGEQRRVRPRHIGRRNVYCIAFKEREASAQQRALQRSEHVLKLAVILWCSTSSSE
ncbi:hypothetical protein ATANTOWER_013996, partial [Ataeniobius toweri]|nr:hypothetical protein [Ataeniobius toweri]